MARLEKGARFVHGSDFRIVWTRWPGFKGCSVLLREFHTADDSLQKVREILGLVITPMSDLTAGE